MSLDDPYAAWCFDEAVYLFGGQVENQLDQAESRTNDPKQKGPARERTLRALLAEPEAKDEEQPKTPTQGAFRDPAALIKKK